MNDRELLELAAKASDLKVIQYSEGYGLGVEGDGVWWNPLGNDGQALRLAIDCSIQITPGILKVRAQYDGYEAVYEDYDGDESGRNTASGAMSSVRRAIVRAAAEIGRTIP